MQGGLHLTEGVEEGVISILIMLMFSKGFYNIKDSHPRDFDSFLTLFPRNFLMNVKVS